MNLHKSSFVKSAAASRDFIDDGLPMITFSGRSNVGKSSVINSLLNHSNFARTSSTPGKTAHINYFLIDNTAYFVDLPGYGYAKVSKKERDRWAELMEDYFSVPGRITLGILIVDARHTPTGDDKTMANWFRSTGRPLVVAANKTDKLNKSERENCVSFIRSVLGLGEPVPVVPYSAQTGAGRDALISIIETHVRTL